MNDDAPFGELLARTLHQLEEMLLVGVNSLVLEKAEEMELRVVLLPVRDEVLPLRALEELARGKPVVDALQLLDDDTPSAHVEVTDLGRPLVAVGKPDRLAAAVEKAVRVARPDLVDDRRLCAINRIAVGAGVDSPAVADDENYWSHFSSLETDIIP